MIESAEFYFRLWVYPKEVDETIVETWWHGLESTEDHRRFVSEWATESLNNEDAHELFDLEHEKCWQVIGKAFIKCEFDVFGDYDETIDIISFEKAEISETWLNRNFRNNLTDL